MSKIVVESSAEAVVELNEKIHVLHVDDESSFLKIAKQCLELHAPVQVDSASSVEEAFKKLRKERYDVIVSDYEMPIKNGLDFLRELRKQGNAIPFIMFTGRGKEEVAIRALNLGANQYLDKTGEPETVYAELAHTVTELAKTRKTEEALRCSEQRYRSFVDLQIRRMPIGYIVWDKNFKAISWNPAAETIFQFSAEEAIGKHPYQIIVSKKAQPAVGRILQRLLEGNETAHNINDNVTKDGRTITCSWTSAPLKREDGSVIGVLSMVEDVTERQEAEQTLRESEARFKSISDIVGDWIWEVDTDGKYTYSNSSVQYVLGYLPEEVLGKHFYDFYPADEQEKLRDADMKIFARKERFTTFVHRDGHLVVMETRAVPIVRPDGKILGYRGSDRDVTETRQAQKALKESEERFKQLFAQNPEATCYVDANLCIVSVNPRFQKLFGYGLDEIKGRNINDLVVPEDMMEEARSLDRKAEKDEYVDRTTVRKNKDGSLFPVFVSAAPISVEGKFSGYVAVYKDISELKKTEHSLAITNEKLQIVGGLTRHDVRNKLSTISGNAYLLKKQLATDSRALEELGDIEAAVEQTVRILDFAKVYEMLGVEELIYIDVEKAINEALSLFPIPNDIRVTNNCHGLEVLADSLLRQLFYNLADNSLKYGQKVTDIRVYCERKTGDQLRLVYEDNGVGITYNAKSKLFNKGFTTGKGTGYGLYMIKKMVEVYGWTIEETGEPGKGATFAMTIPQLNPVGKQNYRFTGSYTE